MEINAPMAANEVGVLSTVSLEKVSTQAPYFPTLAVLYRERFV